MMENILVRFDVSGYSLTVYFDHLNYDNEHEKYGDKFIEVMYNKALKRMMKDGASLPPFQTSFEVEPY